MDDAPHAAFISIGLCAAMTSPTVLLTLGRLPKALDIARSFHRAGWRVVVADPFAWHVCAVSRAVARSHRVAAPAADQPQFLADITRIAREENAALIIPISEETLHVSALVDALPGVRVLTQAPARLVPLHSKHAFIETARAAGLTAPETYRLEDARAQTLAAEGDVIIKPEFSCSGRGVSLRRRNEDAPWPARTEAALAQRCVEGEALSSFSLVHQGRVLVTVVYRGLVMSGTVAVCFERVDAQPAIKDWVDTFAAHTRWSGFLAFDFIVDANHTPWAIECNPRLTSGVHFLHPEDLAPALIDPADTGAVRLRETRRLQHFYPVLTETRSPMFWTDAFKRNSPYVFSTREASWSLRDPLPFALAPFTSAEIIGRAMTQGISFGQAATADIEWRPEHARATGSAALSRADAPGP